MVHFLILQSSNLYKEDNGREVKKQMAAFLLLYGRLTLLLQIVMAA